MLFRINNLELQIIAAEVTENTEEGFKAAENASLWHKIVKNRHGIVYN